LHEMQAASASSEWIRAAAGVFFSVGAFLLFAVFVLCVDHVVQRLEQRRRRARIRGEHIPISRDIGGSE
ncbi:MAG TPA: hypothetical protein VK506_11570, partial [Conexibacter sp.]|nr:hypothetical protein [Conexibacter sp.]